MASGKKSTPQELTPVDALAQLSFLVQGTLERRAAEHDLSLVQTRLLGILRDRQPTMNQLGRLLGLDKSSTTGLVTRAERRGLVARVPSQTDRRSVTVALTDTGRALVTSASGTFADDVTALFRLLPKADRKSLATLASRLLTAHARANGVDLFATDGAADSQPGWPEP